MKIANLLLAGSILFGVSAYAHEGEQQEESSPLYLTVKGMYAFGEDYTNDAGVVEKGDAGIGIGVDFGYELAYGFALELDGTFETADVQIGEEPKETIDYYAASFDVVYVYELTEKFGVLGKVGVEYEYETVGDEHNDETGMSYAIGAEYVLNRTYNAVVEYEGSTIDGPKGDAVMAGVKIKF